MEKLITAGCGISQVGFDKWPTWTKYCTLTHHCDHVNVGGPASGNEHIARSIIRSIYEKTPTAVIIVWTSYNKLDVYVEDLSRELQIKNFPTRNFLINYKGKIVSSPGWWPSSVSEDNDFKIKYKDTLESDTYYYIRTLESIISVQNICKLKNIKCYMFLGYGFNFDIILKNPETEYLYHAIDWDLFVDKEHLEKKYESSKWFKFNSSKRHGLIPVAGWHYDFYIEQILPILDQHYKQKNLEKFWELRSYVEHITQSYYEKGIS